MQKEHRIGRRVYTTVCEVVLYNAENELETRTVSVVGNYNDKERLSAKIARMLGTSQVIVKTAETTSKFYSMSMDDFIKHADKITD